MAKSAQEKFNEYLSEYAETTDAVNQLIDNSMSYAWSAGALSTLLQDAISNLPRAKRAEFRDRIYSLAQKQKNQKVINTLAA